MKFWDQDYISGVGVGEGASGSASVEGISGPESSGKSISVVGEGIGVGVTNWL